MDMGRMDWRHYARTSSRSRMEIALVPLRDNDEPIEELAVQKLERVDDTSAGADCIGLGP